MFTTRKLLAVGLIVAWFGLAAATAAQAQDQVKVVKEICYGDKDEGAFHQLDLYLPAGKDYPVMVFAHGGAWMMGDKTDYEFLGKFFAEKGIAVAVVNYRLSPAIKHPGHVQDVAKAVAWTHANIGKHGGNPQKLYVAGHSAGGQIVSLLGTDESYLKSEGLSHRSIRGVISISGVYAADDLWLGFAFPVENREACFPLHHAKAAHPNFLLYYAETESFGLEKQADRFHTKLKNAGGSVRLHRIDGANHYTITSEKVLREQYSQQIVEFVSGQVTIAKAAK